MWCFWLIAAGVFFVAEIITVGFLVFWLGIGALLAMVASIFTDSIAIQTAVFVISSAILIPLTKPLADIGIHSYYSSIFFHFTTQHILCEWIRFPPVLFINKKDTIPTNSYSLIGKHGIVTLDINPIEATGQVKVNGEVWSAKTDDESSIAKGTEVEVLKIDGVKLVVSPIRVTSVL